MNKKATFFQLLLSFLLAMLMGSVAASPAEESITDRDIIHWVKNALRNDVRGDVSGIEVTVKDGIVTLSGEVSSLAEKEYATADTRKIRGVKGVINELVVNPAAYNDDDVCHMVRRRILNSAIIQPNNRIEVNCDRGKVTLSGEVTSWAERDEATLLASEVDGVTEVENRILLKSAALRSDEQLQKDAATLLELDPYLNGLPLEVTVENGEVVLSGSVRSLYERNRAAQRVALLGVKRVVNNLEIDPALAKEAPKVVTSVSDEELKLAVRTVLDLDSRIDARKISVTADSGHVVLSGMVINPHEKRIAGQDAKDVVGVGWVTNNLVIRVPKRDDRFIREDVVFNLHSDHALVGTAIVTRVSRGVVTLTGQVHNWYQKTRAERIAERVRGVKKVNNQLRVYRAAAKSDQELAREVRKRLKWNWITWWVHDKIKVDVENGVATLTGDVDTWSERAEAAKVALETEGIWEVENRLTVSGFTYRWDEWYKNVPDAYDPYYDPGQGTYHGLYNERWW